MCTAVTFQSKDHYFGRNLDLEYSYQESVTVTPRNFPLIFRRAPKMVKHYALIGMALIADNYPLYYDATNEFGLSMAGLNFPGNAVYYPEASDCDNITPFELIPWILGQCKTVSEARILLTRINIVNIPFSVQYPLSPLHWIIADKHSAITVETLADGMKIYENLVGVLTNNPPFDFHIQNLTNYLNLTHSEPENRFSDAIVLSPYSRGMGAFGLPGDLSSASRFVRAAFTKLNSKCGKGEEESVSQFFHILGAVYQQYGCVSVGDKYEMTVYSSCCNTDRGIYYYTTYGNSTITAVDMNKEDLSGTSLSTYSLRKKCVIEREN